MLFEIDDVGEYTCIARNQFGEAICTVNIQPEMFQQAGKLIHYLNTYNAVY